MLCSTCHTGGTHNTDATYAASLNTCSTCHAPSSACFTNYGTDQCITCHTTVHGPKLLHHFAFANITTQQAGIPFNITVTAKDYSNNTVAGFTGMADITVTGGSSPAIPTANFVGGVWSGEVTVSQPGTGKTLTATRSGGNETGISNPFTVLPAPGNYVFEWLEPVSLEKPFQQGETVPVKFKLTDSNDAIVSTASACLELYPVSEDTMAGDPVVIESNADPGTCFRFSEDHYIYNLDTGNLAPGTYHLHAVFTDGRVEMIKMTLKAKNKKQ